MKLRAAIFDIYNTLLEVSPPPVDAARRWELLGRETLGAPVRLNLDGFKAACEAIIAREQGAARAVGVTYPEIYWPAVAAESLPDLARLSEAERDTFLYRHAQLQRTVRLMPGAAELLRELAAAGKVLGIASNAQPYTLRELDAALVTAGLSRAMFEPRLCFWSFEAGFSKPDPHAFRWLTARLQALNIRPAETLMVGDRLDNDVAPAKAQGWQTWHFATALLESNVAGGDLRRLGDRLKMGC